MMNENRRASVPKRSSPVKASGEFGLLDEKHETDLRNDEQKNNQHHYGVTNSKAADFVAKSKDKHSGEPIIRSVTDNLSLF